MCRAGYWSILCPRVGLSLIPHTFPPSVSLFISSFLPCNWYFHLFSLIFSVFPSLVLCLWAECQATRKWLLAMPVSASTLSSLISFIVVTSCHKCYRKHFTHKTSQKILQCSKCCFLCLILCVSSPLMCCICKSAVSMPTEADLQLKRKGAFSHTPGKLSPTPPRKSTRLNLDRKSILGCNRNVCMNHKQTVAVLHRNHDWSRQVSNRSCLIVTFYILKDSTWIVRKWLQISITVAWLSELFACGALVCVIVTFTVNGEAK